MLRVFRVVPRGFAEAVTAFPADIALNIALASLT